MSNNCDIPVPQAKYSLLHTDRKSCFFRNKLILIGLSLIIASCISLSIYIATIGIYDRVLYPKGSANKAFPQLWINRAISYSEVEYTNVNSVKTLPYKKAPAVDAFKLVCYYSLPTEKTAADEGVLLPSAIDPNLCTHINAAFATVVNNSIYLTDYQLGQASSLINLKKQNPNLKVLISVGGAGNEHGFSDMVLNHENRKEFIKSINVYVREHKFDGIDLDWEFPNRDPAGDKKQKMHFTQLLHEVRNEINRQDKHKFLLSVAVAAPVFIVDSSYDVSYMNDYVDYINVMTYDFHFYTKVTPFTGLNAPLYSMPNEVGYFATLNINYSANYWHTKGMDKSKIIVGLPTYGHSFKLMNPDNNRLNAPAKGYGTLGSNGFVDFNDVCWFLNKNQIKPFFDTEAKSPYAVKYTEWVSYDDQTSLTFKAEFIKDNDFGGAMVLSLNTDDHQGFCQDRKATRFPLTNRIKTILNDQQL